jgi:hypothetical protein
VKKDKCLDFYSVVSTSVADPDPRSGAFFDPWIQDPGSRSGMNNADHISESLETIFWVKKILILFDADPGSGLEKIRIRKWKKIRIRNPG